MVKINSFEAENIKRIRAVQLEPSAAGLTVIGGDNAQGKTSVLDSIAWALGGDKFRPSKAEREGSVIPPRLSLTLSNGLLVERSGKNGDLKVTDAHGNKAGQQLLNSFIEQLALDLPRFLNATGKEKAQTLLHIIGVGDTLAQLERSEQDVYNRRRAIGQIADQKTKFAREMTAHEGMPKEPISASELLAQQQDILACNGENARKRNNLAQLEQAANQMAAQIADMVQKQATVTADLEIARKSALDLHDESTAALEDNLREIDEINRKVRANLDREKAAEDAASCRDQYDALTTELDAVRLQKMQLLDGANLPLAGLSVLESELTYNGQKWDNMSGADQLIVATAIVRKLNPDCGFVLLDKLEQMDLTTLHSFGQWLEAEGLQAIATRVSTGGECSIIIEDGLVKGAQFQSTFVPIAAPAATQWKDGAF